MKSLEIREAFLKYFKAKAHRIVPSASLVPSGDPTLLLNNAGMVQFKPYFLGEQKSKFSRAASCQKCIRVVDIERVGSTARHLTFFEMLGNFSFGDYYKEGAAEFAWEFLTQTMGIAEEKLSVSVFRDDDEAAEVWHQKIGVPHEKIFRFGEEDNFWAMGPTGPCGPCSEIYVDRGQAFSCGRTTCAPGCDCDRFVEIWNLVFMQYNRKEDDTLEPLPRKNIDTGMGLERLTMILQKTPSIFHTDLFRPVIEHVEQLIEKSGSEMRAGETELRIISDHVRSATFLIGDGVLPANEGRGYVLRRLIRRASQLGKTLGLDKPYLHKLMPTVRRMFGGLYTDLKDREGYIARVLEEEETRFLNTLERGMLILEEELAGLRRKGENLIPGSVVFRLWDTYGFPPELTRAVITQGQKETTFNFDMEGFYTLMDEQKERARKSARFKWSDETLYTQKIKAVQQTKFVGYETLKTKAKVLAILRGDGRDKEVSAANKTIPLEVILDETPFYAEGGGQVGDEGAFVSAQKELKCEVVDTQKLPAGHTVHRCVLHSGVLKEGDEVEAQVDAGKRLPTMRHHTATHLLHAAIRTVLGPEAMQSGSLVAPDRLRFDFPYFRQLTQNEISNIENLVNEKILENISVNIQVKPIEEARKMGAVALFEEKYGDQVRVVDVSLFSMELCGGTHVGRTGDIGLFKIISEESIGQGLRRIEAVAGDRVLSLLNQQTETLEQIAELLKVSPSEVLTKVEKLIREAKEKEDVITKIRRGLTRERVQELLSRSREIDGAKLVVAQLSDLSIEELRDAGDQVRMLTPEAAVLLASSDGLKVSLVSMATKGVVDRGLHMGNILREVAKMTGGSGGGRPDMAQGGGKNPEKLGDALKEGERLIAQKLLEVKGRT